MSFLPYVNIKQGTQSVMRFSNGNTLPMTQLPFGMAGFAPQTDSSREPFFFHPQDRSIEGIRLTHQPSPWIGDYSQMVFMPQCGPLCASANMRWSGYRPQEAQLRPDYINVRFLRYRSTFELAPTERGAVMHVTYDRNEQPRFAVLPVTGENSYKLDVEKKLLTGYTTAHSWSVQSEKFRTYFAISFDCDLVAEETYITHDDNRMEKGLSATGTGVGIFVGLASKDVTLRFAISYISEEQAIRSLKRECAGKSLEEVRREAAEAWEARLSTIEVETETEEQKKTFYSCFYHMFLYPHKFYEPDENGDPIHYDCCNDVVQKGIAYTDNGFWDTYRTVYPMLAIVAPDTFADILKGFVNSYKDTGWLPRWPSAGEAGIMTGTLIDAVIAEAAVRGIGDRETLEAAFEGMLKHATMESDNPRFGRHCIEDYQKLGYVPREKYRESVTETMDYVYGDFCISQVAKVLGKMDIAAQYEKGTKNYKNLFDKETGFMRGRDSQGNMAPDFDMFRWGGEYTEGGPWQSSFAVPHDVEGLAELHGGKDKLIEKLDELFATPPHFLEGGYGFEIHEMTEMAAADFGQCAISNQPSFHIPYLFAALGDQEKTNYWVKKLVEEAFTGEDDGFPGDEDNGTMSGWYVFSCLGFYPLCPGKGEYVPGIRLVKDAKIKGRRFHLENGQLIFD